jgi:hypothetical protein
MSGQFIHQQLCHGGNKSQYTLQEGAVDLSASLDAVVMKTIIVHAGNRIPTSYVIELRNISLKYNT